MKHLRIAFTVIALLASLAAGAQEQEQESKEEQEKKFRENVDKTLLKMEDYLDLEGWQVFYMDSILYHDLGAMRDEMMALQKQHMTNSEAYSRVSDKWNEKIYQAVSKVLNEQQWAKYLKLGEAKAKRERDKRQAKREGTE